MSAVNKIKEFIRKYGIRAEILEFKDTVESVASASRASGVSKDKILKTLIVIAGSKPYAVILPGDKKLDFKRLAVVTGAEKIRLARHSEVINITGFKPGEVSPLTEDVKKLNVVVDESVLNKGEVLVGGGSLHHLVLVNVNELIRVLKPKIANVGKKID